ncbi:MAG: hypothetical protein JW982_03510 [Spirochaetes bacterium]|nr:hypothetical protein [Spirochaetota bacterium]
MRKAFLFIILSISAVIYADNMKTADSIEFEGLKNISRNDIVFYGQIGLKNNKIVYNEKILLNYLDNESLIKKYKLIDKNNTLCIIVEEHIPDFCILIETGSGNRLAVLNADSSVISTDRAASDIPVIIVSEEYFKNSSPADELMENLELYREIRGKYKIWNQIQTLKIEFDSLRIRCFNRRTDFIIENSASGFYKLNNIVAYLDRIEFYPEKLNLKKNLTVIK